jgi:hypothetical protein
LPVLAVFDLLDGILNRVGGRIDVAADAAHGVGAGSHGNGKKNGQNRSKAGFHFYLSCFALKAAMVETAPTGISMTDSERPESQKVQVIACGMIAREVLAVKQRLGLDHLDLTCLPAEYHYHPQRIAPAMDEAISAARAAGYGKIFVGYADCGTGGLLDRVCEKHGVERIEGPHCFAFYQGMEAFRAVEQDDMMSFYMTDFLCRQFDAFFIKPLGLDRHPELIDDFFGNYEKLIYLAQTNDPALDRVAEDAAKFLGLKYERRFTGYGDLSSALEGAAAPAD